MQSTESNHPDLYAVLGVDENATQEQITRAYRKKCMEHHPDRWAMQNETIINAHKEIFQEVNTANEILSDPQTRTNYNQSRSESERTLDWVELVRRAEELSQRVGDLVQDFRPYAKNLKPARFHQLDGNVYLLQKGEKAIFNGGNNITFENNTALSRTGLTSERIPSWNS